MMRRALGLLVSMAAAVAVAGGCASSEAEETTTVASSTRAAGVEVVEVLFDGAECTADRESVPAGKVTFVLTTTEGAFELWVRTFAEGYTYADLVAFQDEAGGPGAFISRPQWVLPGGRVDFQAPRLELDENQRQQDLVMGPGSYGLLSGCYTCRSPGGDIGAVWLCGNLEVVEG
jgi:hypothetical protein